MTLLTCVFAAIICSILWYKHAPDNTMRLGALSLMYWGASLMWLGDAIFEYAELHEAFFCHYAPESQHAHNPLRRRAPRWHTHPHGGWLAHDP